MARTRASSPKRRAALKYFSFEPKLILVKHCLRPLRSTPGQNRAYKILGLARGGTEKLALKNPDSPQRSLVCEAGAAAVRKGNHFGSPSPAKFIPFPMETLRISEGYNRWRDRGTRQPRCNLARLQLL